MSQYISPRHASDQYYILVRDLIFNHPNREPRSRKYDSVPNISEYLKGTLLREMLIRSPTNLLTCVVMDTDEIIHCEDTAVEVLDENVMLLLLAISSCKERFEVFRNRERLADGLEMQPGCSVIVRHQSCGELPGKLRYKGELAGRLGIHFGVELINARGKGTTNGTISKYRYFDCPEDSGMFLSLSRVMSKRYDQHRTPGSLPRRATTLNSPRSLPKQPLSMTSNISSNSFNQSNVSEEIIGVGRQELESLGIYIGMEVYIFTEVGGVESQESGKVKFIGRLPNELPTPDIYVGIDLVNAVGNGRGVFNKRHLFKTRPNHAALVPLSGVLPADTCDTTPPLHASGIQETMSKQPHSGYIPRDIKYGTEPRRRHTHDIGHSSDRPFHDYASLADDYYHPYASDPIPRHSQQRGPPDGRPLTHIDDDLPSVDIYGGSTIRNDQDRGTDYSHNTFPLSASKKKLTKKISPKLTASVQSFDDSYVLEVDSMVEVIDGVDHIGDLGIVGGPVRGVVKWIGQIPGRKELIAGVELEMPFPGLTDGSLDGRQFFSCLPERALFTSLRNCRGDPRFTPRDDDESDRSHPKAPIHNFGGFEASSIEGNIAPPSKLTDEMVGKGKGIQGHHNSCYLDSTLFSMFAYSYCLDSILFRKRSSDLPQYKDVQQVLTEDIVNPLRKRNFVRADRIMKLRELLDALGSVTGLTSEEKDPEEFLQTLLNHVFKADPLFELRQGDSDHVQECYFYQIFLDKDEKMVLPSTQLLMEQSFLASDLKFRDVPVCLILQMPRFGKDYKMYNRVRPSLTLDVTDMVEKLPRNCTVCGGLAEYECQQCSIERSMQEHISSYCDQCTKICHQHPLRRQHKYKKIEVSDEYRSFVQHEGEAPVERHVLELYAVLCIETSHYVSFAKCGSGRNARWCFFDSMADRVGEQSGYNIPEVTWCDQFEEWLEMDQSKILEMERKKMPDHMRRIFCDAYMCLYQSREMMCYT